MWLEKFLKNRFWKVGAPGRERGYKVPWRSLMAENKHWRVYGSWLIEYAGWWNLLNQGFIWATETIKSLLVVVLVVVLVLVKHLTTNFT